MQRLVYLMSYLSRHLSNNIFIVNHPSNAQFAAVVHRLFRASVSVSCKGLTLTPLSSLNDLTFEVCTGCDHEHVTEGEATDIWPFLSKGPMACVTRGQNVP
jgi:hypothetical protein